MGETKRTWEETLDALENTYTMSFRSVCRLLKASRPWVNRYIKPHVDVIYLNSNRRGELQMGENWVKRAAKALDREDMTESVWFNKEQLFALLERSVVQVTKQIKSVPLVYLIDESQRSEYITRREALLSEYKRTKNLQREKELVAQITALPEQYIDEDGMELLASHVGIVQRGCAERVEVDYPGTFDPGKWIAAHDLKDYGDTDEDVYRRLFRRGCIRVELCVPDENGEPGSKIYYVEDPEFIENIWDDRALNIPVQIWQKYANKKGI